MIFGQVLASPQELSSFVVVLFWIVGVFAGALVGLAALISIISSIRGKPASEQFVTKAEITPELLKLENSVDRCALKEDVDKIAQSLAHFATKDEVKEVRDSIHRLGNVLQPMVSDVARMAAVQEIQEKQIGAIANKMDDSHGILKQVLVLAQANGQREKTA